MDIIYHKKVIPADLPDGAIAETYLSCIQIIDVNSLAKTLITDISDTSWISELSPVGQRTFQRTAIRTIDRLVQIFQSVDSEVTEKFGEFMISMSSGHYLENKCDHDVLPLSEIWKPKILGNEGFDFHTVSPSDKFSFGEAKFRSSGNAYGEAAEQISDFINNGKDNGDIGLLNYFNRPIAINNLLEGKRGFIVAFSINSDDHELILNNSLDNEDIKNLSKGCDELYIIGVKS